jgi:hypothetical protein
MGREMDIDLDRDRLIRDFCKAMGVKPKRYQSPKRIAYELIANNTKNRRGTRSINQYLDDHAELMRTYCERTHTGAHT